MLNVFNIKYTMDRPKFLISNKKEESISALRVNSRSKQQSYLKYKMHPNTTTARTIKSKQRETLPRSLGSSGYKWMK